MTSENSANENSSELAAIRVYWITFCVTAVIFFFFFLCFGLVLAENQTKSVASEDKPLRVQVEFVNAKDAAAFSTVALKSEALGKAIDTYARKTNKESRKDFAEPLEPMLCQPQQHATSKNLTERN
jgi:hypothetical protein